jgi:hypothetical protein
MSSCSRCGKTISSKYIVCFECYKSKTFKTRKGYLKFKDSGEYVHREIAATKNNVPLTAIRVVHHKNGIKTDNRPDNLQILPDQAAHARLHKSTEVKARVIRNSRPKKGSRRFDR